MPAVHVRQSLVYKAPSGPSHHRFILSRQSCNDLQVAIQAPPQSLMMCLQNSSHAHFPNHCSPKSAIKLTTTGDEKCFVLHLGPGHLHLKIVMRDRENVTHWKQLFLLRQPLQQQESKRQRRLFTKKAARKKNATSLHPLISVADQVIFSD